MIIKQKGSAKGAGKGEMMAGIAALTSTGPPLRLCVTI